MTRESVAWTVLFTLLAPAVALATESTDDHRRRQRRPIELGTSGGNVEDFSLVGANAIVCCGGTLGALLEKKGRYFVLSNNHVLARLNAGEAGEPVVQPGLNDANCEAPGRNQIGVLSGFKKLKLQGTNKVDAAIAEVDLDDVAADGSILDLGIPGNSVVKPRVGAAVVKSGRTTGLTHGEVTTLNVTGFVTFPTACGSDTEVEVRFKKAVLIVSTDGGPFSQSGDSGSVIYEDADSCPRAMGLLFAGNDDFTAANPMKRVMKDVKKMAPKGKATLVGCDSQAAASFAAFDDPAERFAMRAQRRHEDNLLAMPGVFAMGLGRDRSGDVVFRVFVDRATSAIDTAMPRSLDGVPVEVVRTARLRALDCPFTAGTPAARGGLRLGG